MPSTTRAISLTDRLQYSQVLLINKLQRKTRSWRKKTQRSYLRSSMLTVIMLIDVVPGRMSPPTHSVSNKQHMTRASRILLLFLLKRNFKEVSRENGAVAAMSTPWSLDGAHERRFLL